MRWLSSIFSGPTSGTVVAAGVPSAFNRGGGFLCRDKTPGAVVEVRRDLAGAVRVSLSRFYKC